MTAHGDWCIKTASEPNLDADPPSQRVNIARRNTLSTAKTTLLPANHSLDTKKGLHSTARLDDSQGQSEPLSVAVWKSA
ncbi:hypothetical protein P7L87_24780 [Vibrio parahaemolyticus]|nr:hypothetical protein [Vibrio parahaemolyticus]